MECTFVVGDLVIMSYNGPWLPIADGFEEICPKLGVIYTVRDIEVGLSRNTLQEIVALRFEEIVNKIYRYDDGKGGFCDREVAFDYRCFRKVKPTDISVFKSLLKPIGAPTDSKFTRIV